MSARLGSLDGASGHLIRYVVFRNISRSTCVLSGYPKVVASGPGRPDVIGTGGSWFGFGHSGNMRPGGITLLGLETDTYCAARPGGGGPADPYDRVRVMLAGGGTVTPASSGDKLDLGCGLHIRSFATPDYPVPVPVYPLNALRATIDVPSRARAGTTLSFVVELRNTTGHSVSLTPCPGYVEAIGSARDSKVTYALNCVAVRSVGAHHTLRFAMRMAVPADSPTGPTHVVWALVGGPLARPASVTVVE